ncbi:MAG TPA: tetratricopeptide repeat protein [Chryseosolibacter sp.]|nr:tetratricopeptide repeat protein [Chryseosolibacter sp.]
MQKLLVVILVSIIVTQVCGQTTRTYNIDSLKQILSSDIADTARILTLNNLGRNLPNSDTTLALAEQAIVLSQKIGFIQGEAEAYNNIGYWFNQKGNYPRALDNYLKSIKLSETVNFEAGLKRSYNSISTVYLYLKDYNTSIRYARKARALSIKFKDLNTQALAASWLSKAFLELQRIDSSLKYAHESYDIAMRLKEPMPLYFATARLGEIHAVEGNHNLALEYLRLSLQFSKEDGRFFRIAAAHEQLASAFRDAALMDSCFWHAKESYTLSKENNLAASLLSSSLLLSQLHEGKDKDESLRYLKVALAARDSLYNQEKNMEIQALNFNEALRQQEIQAAQVKAAEARKNNLQYAAIVFGLLFFVIAFLLVSHSVLANPTLIKFLGILALLVLFEFINLLMHPLLGDLTHHSPLWMLAIMVSIAALLIPLHHRLEKLVIGKLIEKNNRIKLAAAKKIIKSAEGVQKIEREEWKVKE